MKNPDRAVDQAMAENRPDKQVIRSLWVEAVRDAAGKNIGVSEPLYLTLPGAEGRDIEKLIEDGLISLTQVRSIAQEDQYKIVAVENSNQAILSLQKKFIGLRIKEVPFQNLIRGDEQFSWPQGDDIVICRAQVVNLDLNSPLTAVLNNGDVVFTVLSWIRKLCQIHGRQPRINWTLCLTLHGEIVWPDEVNRYTKNFLRENIAREQTFANGCMNFFGRDFIESVFQEDDLDFRELNREYKQKILMIIVPKIITRLVHNDGWIVHTERNLRYGGNDNAPMVSWIVKFSWEADAVAQPDNCYRESLRDIFSGIGKILENGEIQYEILG